MLEGSGLGRLATDPGACRCVTCCFAGLFPSGGAATLTNVRSSLPAALLYCGVLTCSGPRLWRNLVYARSSGGRVLRDLGVRIPPAAWGRWMRPPSTVDAAPKLGVVGQSPPDTAYRLQIARSTVRDRPAGLIPHRPSAGDRAPRRVEHELTRLPPSCVYLLGPRPGRGCVSTHMRRAYRLTILLDVECPVIIEAAGRFVSGVRRGRTHRQLRPDNCVAGSSHWRRWPCLLPRHGSGRKHERAIVLTTGSRRSCTVGRSSSPVASSTQTDAAFRRPAPIGHGAAAPSSRRLLTSARTYAEPVSGSVFTGPGPRPPSTSPAKPTSQSSTASLDAER